MMTHFTIWCTFALMPRMLAWYCQVEGRRWFNTLLPITNCCRLVLYLMCRLSFILGYSDFSTGFDLPPTFCNFCMWVEVLVSRNFFSSMFYPTSSLPTHARVGIEEQTTDERCCINFHALLVYAKQPTPVFSISFHHRVANASDLGTYMYTMGIMAIVHTCTTDILHTCSITLVRARIMAIAYT